MKQRSLKHLLDRPGTRGLLGRIETARANLRGNRARIFHDGCWIHQFGDDYFAEWTPLIARNLPKWLESQKREWLSFYPPKPGDTIVEIGAGVGIETILFSRAVGETGKVIAVEAHPRTYSCFLKTCQYNRLTNVIPLNIALVDREQPVFLEDDAEHIANAVVPGESGGAIRVRGRSLDDVCAELGIDEIAMLRMNIEGAEKFVIEGMSRMIGRTSYVGIACHDFRADKTGNEFFRTKSLISQYLVDNDFELVALSFEEPWARDHVYAYNRRIASNPLRQQSQAGA